MKGRFCAGCLKMMFLLSILYPPFLWCVLIFSGLVMLCWVLCYVTWLLGDICEIITVVSNKPTRAGNHGVGHLNKPIIVYNQSKKMLFDW